MSSWHGLAGSSLVERCLADLLTASLPPATDTDPADTASCSTGPIRTAPAGVPVPDDDVWLEALEHQLPAQGSLERVAQLHAAVARLQALEADALVGFARAHAPEQDRLVEQPDGSLAVMARASADPRVVDEVAPVLAVGRRTAALRLAEADQLHRCLPVTAELFGLGFVDHAVVRAVVDETSALTEQLAAEVDAGLAGVLVGVPAGRVRREVRRLVAVADAGAVALRVRAATRARCVTYAPLPDGMAAMTAVGPAPAVRAWYEELTSRALATARAGVGSDPFADLAGRAGDRDDRCLDERRFDALGDLVDAAGPSGSPPAGEPPRRGRGAGSRVELTVAVGTLLGLDDGPGELAGHGPVPAVVARAWSRRAPLRRVLVDPVTGVVLGVEGRTHPPGTVLVDAGPPDPDEDVGPPDPGPPGAGPRGSGPPGPVPPDGVPPDGGPTGVGPTAAPCPVAAAGGGPYAVPAALARLVRTAMPRCAAPGCSVPASRCDLDHAVPWPQGPTCACNLHPLCRTHHRMKTVRGWSVRRGGPGGRSATLVWTSPLGHAYETVPEVRWAGPASASPPGRGRRRRRTTVADAPSAPPSAGVSPPAQRPSHDDPPPF